MADECDIDVVEETDSDNGYDVAARKALNAPISASSVADMVEKVLAHIKKDDCCIGTLTIYGHGCQGNISVGNGQHGADPKKEINGRNENVWGPELDKLKGSFCEGGLIILMGCHVGAEQRGADKLFAIATHTGANVEGFTGMLHMPRRDDEGEWVVAGPNSKPDPKPVPTPKQAPKKGGGQKSLLMYRDREAFRSILVDDISEITIRAKTWPPAPPLAPAITLDARLKTQFRDALTQYSAVNGLRAGSAVEGYVDLRVGGRTQQEIGEVPPSYLCGGCRYLVVAGDWCEMYPLGGHLAAELRRLAHIP